MSERRCENCEWWIRYETIGNWGSLGECGLTRLCMDANNGIACDKFKAKEKECREKVGKGA